MRRIMRTHGKNATQMGIEVAACYSLRISGMTLQQISDALAQRNPPIILGRQAVQRRLESEIAMKVQPLAAQVRQIELDRLDHYLVKLDPKVEEGDEKSINTALRVGERRSKLLGLDAPARVEALVVGVTAGSELQELIRAAQQRELAKEAAIIEGEIIGDTLELKSVRPFTSTESQD